MRVYRTHKKLIRGLAAWLCCALLLPMLQWISLTVGAAGTEEYARELAARQEEYAQKFNLETLLWSGATEANGKVNYGNSARNYLYWQGGSFGGVNYKNYIHVYAFEGDTICFGSSVDNSLLDPEGDNGATAAEKKEIADRLGEGATVDIVLTDLRGNRILYDVKENGVGHIPNVQTEVLAKTMESPEGHTETDVPVTRNKSSNGDPETTTEKFTYTPLTYKVTETGVYTIEFHSYDGGGTEGQTNKNDTAAYSKSDVADNPSLANEQHNFVRPLKNNSGGTAINREPTDAEQGGIVAAWDISVFNEQGHKETGRVYADYLSLQQNGGYDVIETYYAVTTDSYIYRWDWKGNRPNTYNFFTDNQGLTDNATGSSLHKSVKELTNTGFDYTRFGASFKYPGSANTDQSRSFYIFFEMPNSDLEGHLYSKAIQPDPAENIRFIDQVTYEDETGSHTVPGSYVGMGGYFAFDTKEATTATLVLNFEKLTLKEGSEPVVDTAGQPYVPVTISGPVKPYSTNYFYWDGKDGDGKVIPQGDYKIEDLITLTTKAGEIHFPVHDMESASGGFTFTRVSPIYDRKGNKISDNPGMPNILDATRSVIYYDDSALYYGEHVGRTGLKEDLVRTATTNDIKTLREKAEEGVAGFKDRVIDDNAGGSYFRLNNMMEAHTTLASGEVGAQKIDWTGGELKVRTALEDYVGGIMKKDADATDFIRIGDHSNTTNLIEYYDAGGDFKSAPAVGSDAANMIDYLDSSKYPVAVSAGNNGANTTDYGISDFWTFIPAEPVTTVDTDEIIKIIKGDAFNLTGQVFFDRNSNGIYDSMKDSDTLLSDITLNLYRQTEDTVRRDGKVYYALDDESRKVNEKDIIGDSWKVLKEHDGALNDGGTYYELFKTGVTPVAGRYYFTNLPYNKGESNTYVYEVVRPDISYQLTSGNKMPSVHTTGNSKNGSYALYAYDTKGLGTEVQVITVGAGGVDPDNNVETDEVNHTVTAVDVGYHYETYTKLKLKKTYATGESTVLPATTVFEVRYVDYGGISHVYDELPMAKIENLEYTYELLSSTEEGKEVKDWYVAAEYYIQEVDGQTYLFKHTFDYDTVTGTYRSFVGDSQHIKLENRDDDPEINQKDLEDTNRDNVSDWKDLAGIDGFTSADSVSAPFHAVLDRNPGTAEITINVTNADAPGVLELLKYTGALEDGNYLQGATFRLYAKAAGDIGDITLDAVKTRVEKSDDAEAQTWLTDHQVGSSSTRANGKVAFAGLRTNQHYVLRETFPPAGYRIMDALYLVHPADGCACEHINDLRNNKKPDDMSDEEWDDLTRQNFFFGQNSENRDYVQAAIANIPANGDMAIRKQIDGRAWNSLDSFTFDIAFRDGHGKAVNAETITDLNHNTGFFTIAESENAIFKDPGQQSAVLEKLKAFVGAFSDGSSDDITINYQSEDARNVITLADGQKIQETLPDTKQSIPLIVNAEVILKPDGNPEEESKNPADAMLNTTTVGKGDVPTNDSHPFPAAGTYTFTVSENALEGGTLISSPRIFTMVVEVTRHLDPGQGEGVAMTAENTYLVAEVRNIYYQDPVEGIENPNYENAGDYNSRRVYAGVAPTFTNTYYVQPAIQTTSYAIEKRFTGRLGTDGRPVNSGDNVTREKPDEPDPTEYNDGWLADDKFTVTIEGADDVTMKALDEGNIYIGGLHGGMDADGNFAAQKEIDFNQTNVTNPNRTTLEGNKHEVDSGHIFKFEEIDFRNIKFPVVWEFSEDCEINGVEYKTGTPVPQSDDPQTNEVISIEEDEVGGVPKGSYFVEKVKNSNTEYSADALYPVVSRTVDVVYTLSIRETRPEGATADTDYTAEGIRYAQNEYTMIITLKNAVGANPAAPNDAVTDGIIDELDFALYDCSPGEIDDDTEPVATCETDQEVAETFEEWAKASFDLAPGSAVTKWTTKWYYVNNHDAVPVIREAEVVGRDAAGVPDRFRIQVDRTVDESGEIFIVPDGTSAGGNVYTFSDAKARNLTFIFKREGHIGDHKMMIENTYSASADWTPTITKTLMGRDWQAGEEFTFTIAATDWPGKVGSNAVSGMPPVFTGEKTFSIQPDGVLAGSEGTPYAAREVPKITFNCPGIYTFTLTESNTHGGGTDLKYGTLNLTVTATDDEKGKLNLSVTADDGTSDAIPPEIFEDDAGNTAIHFVNTYSESGSFPISISKLLTGRSWSEDDTFIFTIAPADDDTKTAITKNTLTVPKEWTDNKDGTYSVTVNQSVGGEKGDAGWETKTLDLGSLNVGNLKTEGAQYKFTLKENTETFDSAQLYCAQPAIDLNLTVASKRGTEGGLTGDLEFSATYAYLTDDGLPGMSVTPEGDVVLPFTNRYYVDTDAPGAVDTGSGFTVEKAFTGRPENVWNPGDNFTVHVAYTGDAKNLANMFYKAPGSEEYLEVDKIDETITFTPDNHSEKRFDFRFFEVGEYTFTVSETRGDVPGVTYDGNTYTVTFNVSKDEDTNTLKINRTITKKLPEPAPEILVTGGTITFENTYEATGSWTPSVTKTLEGRAWQTGEKFQFKLALTDGEPDGVKLPTDDEIAVGKDAEVDFGAVEFTKPGTYTFTITESGAGAGLGTNKDLGQIEVEVKATDNGDGILLLVVTGDEGTTTGNGTGVVASTVNFVNTYAESGSFAMAIAKTLTGRNWEADDRFTFKITPADESTRTAIGGTILIPGEWGDVGDDGAYTVAVTAPAELAEGTVQTLMLGTLGVSGQNGEEKQYVFTISEDMTDFGSRQLYCAQPGVTLAVTVTPEKKDGAFTGDYTYTATYAYLDETGKAGDGTTVSGSPVTVPFINRYYAGGKEPDPAMSGGQFIIQKVMTGHRTGLIADESYTVHVAWADVKGEKIDQIQYFDAGSNRYVTLTPEQTFNYTFDEDSDTVTSPVFRFFEAGDYTFTVREEDSGSQPGVIYDATEYTMTFKVENVDGRLTVTSRTDSSGDKDDGIVAVTNTYIPAPATWTPSVTKVLKGREWVSSDRFVFDLKLIAGDETGVKLSDAAVTIEAATDGHKAGFGAVSFVKAGTYAFTVTERAPGNGIIHEMPEAGSFTVIANVTDDPSVGKLSVELRQQGSEEPLVEKGDSVENTVNFVNAYSENGSFDIAIAKTLTGRNWTADDSFTFAIAPADEATGAAIADKTLTVPWDVDGDGKTHIVRVSDSDPDAADSKDWVRKTHSLGRLTVGNLETRGAVYKFTIREDTGDFAAKNLYCRQPQIDLTITVRSEVASGRPTGKLEFLATYAYQSDAGIHGSDKDAVAEIELPFTNHAAAVAKPEATGSSLAIEKIMQGRDWMPDESYTVELKMTEGDAENVQYAVDGDVYVGMPALMTHNFTCKTADSDALKDWVLNFRFYEEGKYVFTVSEQIPSALKPCVTCDQTVYTVAYTVVKQDGKLEVSRSITSDVDGRGETDGKIVFVNEYKPKPAVWTPSVTKILNGRKWASHDSFSFSLALDGDGDGVTVGAPDSVTITSKDSSTASFGSVTFNRTGTYKFTIAEKDPEHGITTSGVYAITVKVTDDTASGRLTLSFDPSGIAPSSTNTEDGWQYATTTTFENTYSQNPGYFALNIKKTLSGREWQSGDEFTFHITPTSELPEGAMTFPENWTADGDGAYTVTVTNSDTPDGANTFLKSLGDIKINQEGIYGFSIEETTSASGDTYCPEPVILLTVRAMAVTDDQGVQTGDMVVTTFAYSSGGGRAEHNADDDATTVPFVNYAYAGAELNLNKSFVDSTNHSDKNWKDGFFQAAVTLTSAPGQVTYDGVPLIVDNAVAVPLKKEGQKVPLRFLEPGEYVFTVEEVHGVTPGITYDNSVYTVAITVGYDEGMGSLTAVPVITDGAGETVDGITFANTYKESSITGGLTVSKTVVGEDKGGMFRFTVTLSDTDISGGYDGMIFQKGVAEFYLGHGEAVSATGLPAGVDYTVAEEKTEGYEAFSTGAVGRIPASGTVTAAFVNTKGTELPPRVDGTGSLTVTKTVSGTAGESDRDWHFTVKLTGEGAEKVSGAYGEMGFTGGEAEVTLKHGHSVTAMGLPAGLNYTVIEAEAGLDGYDTKASGEKGVIDEGSAATAVFINHRDEAVEPTGGLTVAKTVAGSFGDKAKEWHFTVTLGGERAAQVSGVYGGVTFTGGEAEFTLKHGERKVFTGLPAGLNYSVVEAEADQDGYAASVIGANGTIQENRTASAVFTNTKNGELTAPDHGFLTVSKTVTGNGGEHDRGFAFTVMLSAPVSGEYGGVIFTDGKAEFTLKDGESVTFELPAGTTYTVVEDEAAGYTVASDGWTGTITAGGTAVAAFANDRQFSVGDLTITKTVTGSQGDTDREWNFHVHLGDKSISGEYGDVTLADGEADFTLKHGGSVTITGLPAGLAYAVTEQEANQGDYTTTAVGDTGHIPASSAILVEFVNECHAASSQPPSPGDGYGNLTVAKTVAGSEGDTERDWHFRVELSDASINGQYGDLFFSGGEAEFTLKHGQSATALNLPEGITYIVTEVEADADGYTTSETGTNGAIPNKGTAQADFINSKGGNQSDNPTDKKSDNPTDKKSHNSTDNTSDNQKDNSTGFSSTNSTGSVSNGAPKTGDESHFEFWLTLMILSLVGMAMFIGQRQSASRRGRHGSPEN